LAGADAEVVDALAEFGLHLGLAFQAVDDLLGIWGRPEVTGKPVWSDVRQRKKSLPIVSALCSGEPGSARLRNLLARPELSEAEVALAVTLIEECGGRKRAEEEARQELVLALSALEGAALQSAPRAELVGLARFLGEREY
jgi:geranylgeranyl diphosphate synthase type I